MCTGTCLVSGKTVLLLLLLSRLLLLFSKEARDPARDRSEPILEGELFEWT